MGTADADPRGREPRARNRATGENDRELARREGHPAGERRGGAAARAIPRGSADALHRVSGGAAAWRSRCAARGDRRARGRAEMPAVLAHRRDGVVHRPDLRAVRSLRGRAAGNNRAGGCLMTPPDMPEPIPSEMPAAVPETRRASRYAHPLELGTMASIVALDQITKLIVRRVLPLGDSRSIIPEFLDLTHVHNTGA